MAHVTCPVPGGRGGAEEIPYSDGGSAVVKEGWPSMRPAPAAEVGCAGRGKGDLHRCWQCDLGEWRRSGLNSRGWWHGRTEACSGRGRHAGAGEVASVRLSQTRRSPGWETGARAAGGARDELEGARSVERCPGLEHCRDWSRGAGPEPEQASTGIEGAGARTRGGGGNGAPGQPRNIPGWGQEEGP